MDPANKTSNINDLEHLSLTPKSPDSNKQTELSKQAELILSSAPTAPSTPTPLFSGLAEVTIHIGTSAEPVEKSRAQLVAEAVRQYSPNLLNPDFAAPPGRNPDLDPHRYLENPLIYAVKRGPKELVSALLHAVKMGRHESSYWEGNDNHLSLYASDEDRFTPLMHAVMQEDKDMVNLLLDRGILTMTDNKNRSALIHAVLGGNLDILQLLLDAYAQHQIPIPPEALTLAIEEARPECLKALLTSGADPNQQDAKGHTPLTLAAERSGREDMLYTLLHTPGILVDEKDQKGRTALMHAAEHQLEDAVRQLLDEHAGANTRDLINQTPLMYAIVGGNETIVRALLQAGASVVARDQTLSTPLMLAIAKERETIALILIDAGSEIDLCNTLGESPLALAKLVMKNDTPTPLVEELLRRGANQKYADEYIAEKFFAQAWGLQGMSTIQLSPQDSISFSLEGMPTRHYTMRMLAQYAHDFFQSDDFKSHPEFVEALSEHNQADIETALKMAAPLSSKEMPEMLAAILSDEPVPFVISTGSETHAISVVIHKNRVMICNRGEGANAQLTTSFFSFSSPDTLEALLTYLMDTHPNMVSFNEIVRKFQLDPQGGFSQKPQEVGNCTWASSKGAFAILCWLFTHPKLAKEIYKAFSAYTRKRATFDYVRGAMARDLLNMKLVEQADAKYQAKLKSKKIKPLFNEEEAV